MSTSGHTLTLVVTLTFTHAFAGAKSIFMNGTDRTGAVSGWRLGGTWTVSPLNPGMDVIVSSCADASRDADYSFQIVTEQEGRVSRFIQRPACFPAHTSYSFHEGWFTDDRRALPIMGRTSGHFNVLFTFVDNDLNRQRLLANTSLPASAVAQVAAGRIQEGLVALLASYTPAAVMSGLRQAAADAVSFSYAVAITSVPRPQLERDEQGLAFAAYDAVVILDDLGRFSGSGVRRWPAPRHVFNGRDGGYFLVIAPQALTPGLVGNELLRRNIPTLLSEYLIGERTLVTEGGVTYDRTPIVNPRTGEDIEPLVRAYEGRTSIGVYLAGYADVDGITDCIDPRISPTADNVDADFIPDRFDPDLGVDHRPYSWLYANRPAL